jgi:hypothetical protein
VQGSGNLTYHGGPVEKNPKVFVIFWGSFWLNSNLGSAADVTDNLFADLGYTRYENVLSQYYDSGGYIANSLTFTNLIDDGTDPVTENLNCPVSAVDDSTIQAEVNHIVSSYGMPHNDGNTTYFVITYGAPYTELWNPTLGCSAPGAGNYCAYHSFDTNVNEAYVAIPYSYLPACGTPVDTWENPEGDALANSAAQEEAETITDPQGNAWYDSAGYEVGDKCNFDFSGGPNGLTKLNLGGVFDIQTLYSNASGECVNTYTPDTVGAYIPGSTSYFCLRFELTTGGCAEDVPFGTSGDIPIVGDWTGKGYDSIGVYIPGNPGYFCLHNTNSPGGCDIAVPFGTAGDIPVVGDWTGKGYDSIGVYIPSSGYFCLRNTNTSGGCDISLALGAAGDVPIVGDWFAQGFDTVGVWIPQYGFFCIRNANTTGGCSIATNFGGPGDIPLAGDTTDQLYEGSNLNIKSDSIGVWIPSNGYFCLRNSNVTGPCDVATQFGSGSDIPLLGNWFYEGAGYVTE